MTTATLPTKGELDYSDGRATTMTCASGTTIPKYTVLTLTSANTAATVSESTTAAGYVCAGIAAAEKSSTDSSTKITVWKNGVFNVIASGSITVGAPVKSCGGGYFMQAVAADVASGVICGHARSTGSDDNVFEMRLCIPN